ncbi:hypothetical protein V8E36_005294 [Tilletia maclaganii]
MPVFFQFRPEYPEALYDLERFYECRDILNTAMKSIFAASMSSSDDAPLAYPDMQAKHDEFVSKYGRCEDPLIDASNRLLALFLENERRIEAQEHVLYSGRSQIWLKETFSLQPAQSQQEHEAVHSSDDNDDDEDEEAEEDGDQADLSSSSWPSESTPIVRRTTNAFVHGPVLSPPSTSTASASKSMSFSQCYNTIILFKANKDKYEQGPSSRATSSSQCSASMDFTEVFMAGASCNDKTVIEHSVVSARALSAVSLWPNTIGRHKSIKHIVERRTSSIPVRTAALYAGLMHTKPILTRPVLEIPVRSLFAAKSSIFERVSITPVKRERNSGIPRLVGPNVPARVKTYPRRVTRL